VPMAYSELYSALETGAIDAQEHPLPVLWAAKYYEIQKYLTLTHHAYSPLILVMNKRKFDSLPAESRRAGELVVHDIGRLRALGPSGPDELQRVAHGNHGLRQVAGGGVEIEARLWRCLLLAWSSQAYRHGERLHEIAWHERIR